MVPSTILVFHAYGKPSYSEKKAVTFYLMATDPVFTIIKNEVLTNTVC